MKWRNFYQYAVSENGEIKSRKSGKLLRGYFVAGRKMIDLYIDGNRKRYYIHRLVAILWLGMPDDRAFEVFHLDGNLQNNQVSNLQVFNAYESPAYENAYEAVKTPCEWNGNHYESIKEAAEANNYTHRAMIWLIAQGYTSDADRKKPRKGK